MISPVLPNGVSRSAFTEALAAYRQIVGDTHVIVDVDRLVPYSRLMIPADLAEFRPAGVIVVESVEQVQRVLEVCNQYRIPVWPISMGRNFGYGEALPAVPGQLILDLSQMNKILEVDPVLGTALVEPGVTYHQLYEYLQSNDIPLWLSVPGPGPLVGPVGQALERGQGYTAYGEQYESLCGMEVVLADGSILRTGLGGLEHSTGWQANKYGYGPYLDGLFTQSNFGIVTKLGLWLMRKPAGFKLFAAAFDELTDIEASIDAARELKLHHVIQGPILTGMPLSSLQMATGKRSDVVPFAGPVTRRFIESYTAQHKMPRVGAFATLYGTEDEIYAKYEVVKHTYAKAGARVIDERLLQFAPMYGHMINSMTGRPDLHELNLLNWVGGGGCVWFAPLCPARGSEALVQMNLGWDIMEKHGFDYNGGFFHNGRSLIHAMSLLFNRTDPDAVARARTCFDELLTAFTAKGFGQYRTNIASMARTADTFGAAQRQFNQRLKSALDPNGIIAPGKSGIGVIV